jgi:hypothetical protein
MVVLMLVPAVGAAQSERQQAAAYVLGPDNSDWGALEISRNPQGQSVPSLRLNQNGVLRARNGGRAEQS